jgi:hypothetical protein
MSPLVCYHSTPRRHREAIQRYGLLPNLPNMGQHYGIYVYCDDCIHKTREYRRSRRFWTRWEHRPPNDLWQVGYVGPLCPDQWVTNGLVLFEKPQLLSLVSRLSLVTS